MPPAIAHSNSEDLTAQFILCGGDGVETCGHPAVCVLPVAGGLDFLGRRGAEAVDSDDRLADRTTQFIDDDAADRTARLGQCQVYGEHQQSRNGERAVRDGGHELQSTADPASTAPQDSWLLRSARNVATSERSCVIGA